MTSEQLEDKMSHRIAAALVVATVITMGLAWSYAQSHDVIMSNFVIAMALSPGIALVITLLAAIGVRKVRR